MVRYKRETSVELHTPCSGLIIVVYSIFSIKEAVDDIKVCIELERRKEESDTKVSDDSDTNHFLK